MSASGVAGLERRAARLERGLSERRHGRAGRMARWSDAVEQLRRRDPELAHKVACGDMSLDDALAKSGAGEPR